MCVMTNVFNVTISVGGYFPQCFGKIMILNKKFVSEATEKIPPLITITNHWLFPDCCSPNVEWLIETNIDQVTSRMYKRGVAGTAGFLKSLIRAPWTLRHT